LKVAGKRPQEAPDPAPSGRESLRPEALGAAPTHRDKGEDLASEGGLDSGERYTRHTHTLCNDTPLACILSARGDHRSGFVSGMAGEVIYDLPDRDRDALRRQAAQSVASALPDIFTARFAYHLIGKPAAY